MNRVALNLCALLLAAPLSAGWTQWGGPGRDFSVPDSGLAERWPSDGPRELWRQPLNDGYSGMALGQDLLITLHRDDDRDAVVAFDATNGETLWTHAWQSPAKSFMDLEFGPGPHSTPLIVGERVFAIGRGGRLVALDRSTGRHLWSRELWEDLEGTRLERGYAASAIAFGDLVIVPVGGAERALVAFRQATGTIAWSRHDHGAAYASPVLADVDGEIQLVALLDKVILGLDPETGDSRWSFPLSDHRYVNVASPMYSSDGLLFLVSSEGGRVLRLERDGDSVVPRELWVGKAIGSQVGNAIRFGDHLYGTRGASASTYLTGVNIETGEIAWRDRTVGDCTLVRVGDRALVLESDGHLHLARLSAEGLELLASAKVLDGRSWTAPALVGTRLYLRNRTEIVALDLAPEIESPPSPPAIEMEYPK